LPRFTKTQLAIPALIVVLAVAAGGAQVWGQHAARMRVDETLASLPAGASGRYASLSYNVFTRTLRISDLRIARNGQPALSVQGVVLHHVAGAGSPADPFRTAALRLDDVQVWRAGHRLTVALVQATDVALLAPGVQPPPGTPDWLVAPGSATLVGMASATADGIGDDSGATLGALSIAGYSEGKLAQLSAVRFSDRQGDRIAAAGASDVDLGGLDRVFDTGRYGPDAPAWTTPHPLIGHVMISGFETKDAGSAGGVASLIVDGFAARPFRAAPTAAYVKTPAFTQDAAEAVSVASASVTGLHFTDSQTKDSGTVGTISATGYADGALAGFVADKIVYAGPGSQHASLGHFALTGLVATKFLHTPPGASADTMIAAAGNGGVRLATFDLSAASVSAPNGAVLAVDSLSETTTGTAPVENTLTLRGLSIPANASPDLAMPLGLIGVDRLVFDLDEALSFDDASGSTIFKRVVLTARGLGKLSLSGTVTGVPHEPMSSDDTLAAIGKIAIGPFAVTFTNDTLVQRAIAAQAKISGKTPQEMTDQLKLAASFMAAGVVPQQPDAGEQVAAFIADPKTLTITAAPAAPIPLATFLGGSLPEAQQALNLRLSAQ
jgi:hypothetical protein